MHHSQSSYVLRTAYVLRAFVVYCLLQEYYEYEHPNKLKPHVLRKKLATRDPVLERVLFGASNEVGGSVLHMGSR